MAKKVQDDRIVVRIDTDTKEKFMNVCINNEITPSDYLRNFIIDIVNNGYKPIESNDELLQIVKKLQNEVDELRSNQDDFILKIKDILIKS
jgi:antitoxin component of RelBE/YafQ-DinJ toxin-antitoxin module